MEMCHVTTSLPGFSGINPSCLTLSSLSQESCRKHFQESRPRRWNAQRAAATFHTCISVCRTDHLLVFQMLWACVASHAHKHSCTESNVITLKNESMVWMLSCVVHRSLSVCRLLSTGNIFHILPSGCWICFLYVWYVSLCSFHPAGILFFQFESSVSCISASMVEWAVNGWQQINQSQL